MNDRLPLVAGSDAIAPLLGRSDIVVIDMTAPASSAAGHIPGARHLDYDEIVTSRPPALGLLAPAPQVAAVCRRLGIGADTTVVATDSDGGGRAARLLWTLAAWGHERLCLLDGGTPAWIADGHPLTTADPPPPPPTDFVPVENEGVIADRDWITANMGRDDVVLLDTRSPGEFDGTDIRAARGGHIPGAVNYEWTRAMDEGRERRLRPAGELRAELAALGVTPDREVVVYCHSHHRSAHTWLVLRHLGLPRVRGYHGAWSEWGNDPATPVTQGAGS